MNYDRTYDSDSVNYLDVENEKRWSYLFPGKVYAAGILNGIPVDVIEMFVHAVLAIAEGLPLNTPEPNVIADPEHGSLSIVDWPVAPDFLMQIVIGPKEAAA